MALRTYSGTPDGTTYGRKRSCYSSGPRESQPIARILIADDNPTSRNVVQATLDKWGYDVTVCESPNEVKAVMQQEEYPNMAVVSHSVDDSSALDACRMIRRRDGDYVYIILLAEEGRSGQTAEGMTADAALYRAKHEGRHRVGVVELTPAAA